MSSFSAYEYDIDLPPPPSLPSWLGSLCSQIDSYKDITLPQVFIPKSVVHEQQSSHTWPSTRTEEDGRLNTCQLIQNSQDKRFDYSDLTSNSSFIQSNQNDKFDKSYDLHLSNQREAEHVQAAQQWPPRRPVPERQSRHSADFAEGRNFAESSQPRPTCGVKRPAPSQSCRITDSRLTRSFLTPVSSSSYQNQQPGLGTQRSYLTSALSSSQYQQPGLGTHNFSTSSSSSQNQQPGLGTQRSYLTSALSSQYQRPGLGTQNFSTSSSSSSSQNQQPDLGTRRFFTSALTPSQYQRPGLGTQNFSTSSQNQQPDSGTRRFPTSASTYSQYQQPDLGTDSQPDLFEDSPTYSPFGSDARETRRNPNMRTSVGSHIDTGLSSVHRGQFYNGSSAAPVEYTPVNGEENSTKRYSRSVNNRRNVGVEYTPVNGEENNAKRYARSVNNRRNVGVCSKQDCGKGSVTPQMGMLNNPYTPAVINFQGAGGNGMKLHSVEEIPKPYCDIFPFPFFNAVQSMAFDKLLYSDCSVVVSAPTGSGKTALFELAIVRQLLCAQVPLKDVRVIYIGPMKSLCGERVDDWRQKLSLLGLDCMELTGDSDINDFSSLQTAQVICTTPEKWDSVTRRWKDNRQLFQSICLVCIDEVHIVGDGQRGATVEAVITRMKMVHTLSAGSSAPPVRFVAVSATLPNTEDIGEWLSSHSNQAAVFKLGEEYRPVKLQRVVLGYPFSQGSSEFRFDISLNYKLHSVIDNYSHGKPTLVFCSSRKSCQQTAETLVKRRWKQSSFVLPQFRQEIITAASRIQEKKLSELLKNGVGIHHAGLEVQDRKLVEELFRASKLAVLISTSTLSVGVNLPAHLVVVKATHMYLMGVAREYSDQQVLQMIGRAGRPQFDTSATAVIMTKAQSKAKYESLVNGTQVIESMLHKNLTEHVNVEVVLNTITDMADAASWLSHTLLHVRATKKPGHYGLPSGLNTQQVEQKLQDMCMTAIKKLNSLHLVSVDPDTAMTSPTEEGRLMARYCLEFETVRHLMDIPSKSGIEHLIGVISSCSEFQDIQLRTSEKKTLNTLNKDKGQDTIRYPLKGKMKTRQMKVNCLVQAGLGCLHIHDYSLSQDLLKIFRVGQRVTKCLMELLWLGQDHSTLLNAVQLCKAFRAKLWPDSNHIARQLEGIGPHISQALLGAGLTSFQLLEASDPHHLELVVNRHPPFGNRVHDAVTHLPRYELVIQQEKKHQAATAQLVISVSMLNAEDVRSLATCGGNHQLAFIIGDEDNTVVFKWKLSDRMLMSQLWQRTVYVKRALAGSVLHVGLISQDWVGLDIHTEYQPFYTCVVHPHRHLMEAQSSAALTGGGAGHQGPGVAASRQQKEAGGKSGRQRNKSSSSTPGAQKDNKIQQQLNVMHFKLQQFQHTAPAHVQKLTHHAFRGEGASLAQPGRSEFFGQMLQDAAHGSNPAYPVDSSLRQPSAVCPQLKRPLCSTRDPPAAETSPLNPSVSSWEDTNLSPEVNLQTQTWGDLVGDFWDESDFDEPPSKTPKKSDSMADRIGAPACGTGASSAGTGASSAGTGASSAGTVSSGNRRDWCPGPGAMGSRGPVFPTSHHHSHVHSTSLCPAQTVTSTAGPSGKKTTSAAVGTSHCLRAGTNPTVRSTNGCTTWMKPNPALEINNCARTNMNPVISTSVPSTVRSSAVVNTNACSTLGPSPALSTSTCSRVGTTPSVNTSVRSRVGTTPSVNTSVCYRVGTQPGIGTHGCSRPNTSQMAPPSDSHIASSAIKRPGLQSGPAPLRPDQQRNMSHLPGDTKTGFGMSNTCNPADTLASRSPSLNVSRETPASRELQSSKPDVHDRTLIGKENEPSSSGFGWEHLQLYQSSRGPSVNQDTGESSEGEGEEPSWSQSLVSEPPPYQLGEPAAVLPTTSSSAQPGRPVGITPSSAQPGRPVGITPSSAQPGRPVGITSSSAQPGRPVGITSSSAQPGRPVGITSSSAQPGRPVGITSPMVAGRVSHVADLQNSRYCVQSISTANLLQGIF